MKKMIAIAAALLCFAAIASAQPKALGIRATYGVELSYQHNSGPGFFEFDAGLFNKYMDVTAVYDFNIAPIGPLNFYAGPGVFIGGWPNDGSVNLNAGLAAQVGLEYTFDFPLQISLDWRPWFNFVDGFFGHYSGAALGIRYAF
ncbi:MAG: hypothetical protein IJ654_10485 [Bacteroidales bacterium]|nr:hypothetical protein [Bacteroidales bacterium]